HAAAGQACVCGRNNHSVSTAGPSRGCTDEHHAVEVLEDTRRTSGPGGATIFGSLDGAGPAGDDPDASVNEANAVHPVSHTGLGLPGFTTIGGAEQVTVGGTRPAV